MSIEQKTTEFVVFCIENTAKRLKRSGSEIFRELMKTGGIELFLYPSFPTLHTQSKEYIVDEVLSYIGKHNPSFVK
jgi:hypothetical protein